MQWKSVAPDYEVSSDGQVRSFKSGTPKILKPAIRNGYQCVNVQTGEKFKLCYIHRLVAQAFIPNPDNKPQVNHINGIKTDNRVENLEWCTQSENNRHAYITGLKNGSYSKLTGEQACYVRDNPDGLNTCELAAKFSVSESAISLIQRGKTYRNVGGKIRDKCGVLDDVRGEIRQLYVYGSREFGTSALAKRFGVGATTVRRIVHEAD